MIQGARSGKQCIVEAVGQSYTSKKGEIKLLGVSLGSIEELITDLEDFLRQRKLAIWPKTDLRIIAYRQWGIEATKLSSPKVLKLPKIPIEAANLLLTLCHQLTFLLSRQIKAMEKKFVREGGFTENLLRKRLENRLPK
jgi:four helix bundle suffix protein